MKRMRRWMISLTVVLLIGGLLAVGLGWRLSHEAPEWWAPIEPTPYAENLGKNLETTLVNASHEVRPENQPVWKVRIDEEAINAWLATRLPRWIENQSQSLAPIARLSEANVDMTDNGEIRMGGRFGEKGAPLSVVVLPHLDEEGNLVIDPRAASIGRIPVPVPALVAELEDALKRSLTGPESSDLRPIEPVIPLGDENRRLRLIEFDVDAEAITLTWRTEPVG